MKKHKQTILYYIFMLITRLEYVWIDNNYNLRSKIKVMYNEYIDSITKIPEWNYDGS